MAAEVSAVAESGAGDVKVDTGSAANTNNVSASGAWAAELQCASVLSEISSVSDPLGLLVFSGGSSVPPLFYLPLGGGVIPIGEIMKPIP